MLDWKQLQGGRPGQGEISCQADWKQEPRNVGVGGLGRWKESGR